MRRRVSLNESNLNKVIRESVKNVLNELDWRISNAASQKSYNNYGWYKDVLKHVEEVEDFLKEMGNDMENTQAFRLLTNCLMPIKQYVERKIDQSDNLEDLDDWNFKKQHDGMSENEFERTLENTDEDDWTPQQREYDDFK